MFGKNSTSSSSVDVNVTLDLTNPTFSGTTTLDTINITNSGTSITGLNGHELHLNNDNGYYAFEINNYPNFLVLADISYFNTTLGIDAADKQLLFYKENNFWYFNPDNNNKLVLRSGLEAVYNYNNYAFEFYQNGNFRCPGDVSGDSLVARNTVWFGDKESGDDNTDETYMQKRIITSGAYNATELCINVGDDGSNNIISIPVPEETGNTDYVTLGASNGIRHVFSTSGNYYYANSIVPKYTNLPTLSTLQISGSEVLTFANGLYLTGYNYRSASIPIGYYLVIAHLEVTPDSSTNKYIHFGISTTNNLYYSEWGKYYAFHSTHKDTFNFSHYIANDTARDYYFIFTANTEVEVTSSKCTFIRIA